MSDIDGLVKQLGQLTVIEAGELAKKLEETWGLDLDALTSGPAQASATAVVEEKTEYNVMLTELEVGKKIAVLKAIKSIMNIGLMDAKKFVEGELPSAVAEDVPKEKAEEYKKAIEEAGGKVELK